MDHVHSYTPSYPHTDQMHCWPPHHVPNHMHMNPPPQPPVSYDYPPWNCNFGFSCPMICHNCGSGSFATPNYFWRPPYSYNHPYNFPVPPHYTPPQSYQPLYDYQGKAQREAHHCCGCPNHLCSKKETGNVKIEEEGESNRDWKKNESVIPYPYQNWPYPVAWNSPRDYYMKGEERGAPEKFGMNGLRNLGSSNQKNEDGVRNRRLLHREDGNDSHLPFPIIWMPYEPEETEKKIRHKMENTEPKAGIETNKEASLEQEGIKVDQGTERHKEKDSSPMKNVNSDGEKDSNNAHGAKRQSTSKSKSPSKLPPVCLRVDPLPKRKSDNGNKKIVNQKPNEANTSSDKAAKSDDAAKSEVKKMKGTTKTIQVVDGTTRNGEITIDKITTKQHDENLEVAKIPRDYSESFESPRKSESEDSGSERVENNAEVTKPEDVTKEEISKPTKRELTSEEAAIVIQSAYRGFDVRRWEPLKKLKQIAKVRERITEVKNLIQEMELSSDVCGSKQRTIISEIIMSLLLKLDTIQGLHPSIRDVRKSVVRELVALQEKLDALVKEKDTMVDSVTSPQESNLPEPPQNHVDGESRSNDNLEVSGNGSEPSSDNLEHVGPEPLIESSNTCDGTELSSEAITGKQDKEGEIGEKRDAVSVVAKNEDHEDLAIHQTSDLSSDQGKDLDQVKIDETSGLEMSADAHGDEVGNEHVAVHQVSDNVISDELMPENTTADNCMPREDANVNNFVREELSLNENVEDSMMPEGTMKECPVDNKFDDSKVLEDDNESLVSDSSNMIHETMGSIIAPKETSEEESEDVRNDSDTCLARKDEDYVTGNSISNDLPSKVHEEEEAKSQIISDDLSSEVHEEEEANSHIISDDIPSEALEEEKGNIISDDLPSQVCEEEEKNHSISVLDGEKSDEADIDTAN